jgi:hypothetical protein
MITTSIVVFGIPIFHILVFICQCLSGGKLVRFKVLKTLIKMVSSVDIEECFVNRSEDEYFSKMIIYFVNFIKYITGLEKM